jgi:hypothetical protein
MHNPFKRIIIFFIVLFFTTRVFSVNFTYIPSDTIIQPIQLPTPAEMPQAIDSIFDLDDPEISLPRDTITRERVEKDEEPELPASAIPWFTEKQLQNPFSTTSQFVDTTLLGFQHYDFAAENNLFFAHKGNPGHANRSLIFEPYFGEGINFGQHQIYGSYLFSHDNLRFYRPKHVFTDLFYTVGSDREQLFFAKHAQKFNENFHASMQYRLINSTGSFSRLGARNASIYFTGDYLSEDKRYQALGSFIINRIFNHESGGLMNYRAFEENPIRDSIFLENAQSRYRDISINLRHFYRTGFFTRAREGRSSRFINFGRLNHNFAFNRTSFVFEDNNSPYPFYNFPAPHPNATLDSTVVNRIENLASWSNAPLQDETRSFPFNLTVFIKHNYINIQQPHWPEGVEYLDSLERPLFFYSKDSFSQIVQGVELESDEGRLLSMGGYYNVTLGGYNDQDIHAGAHINLGRAGQKSQLKAMLRFSSTEAPYFYSQFASNFVAWNNDFSKTQIVNLNAEFTLPGLILEGNNYLINNAVYFDKNALPVQNTSALGFFDIRLKSDIELGRFGIRNHAVFQQATTSDFESFPTLMSYHSLYMNLSLFEGSLVNQFGFDFYYNTDYYAMRYMPVTRAFYLQEDFTTKNFMLLDAFLNAKIKRTRIFLKYENILGLVLDVRQHYYIPFHPLPESMFKFGISWMFFD